MSTSDEAEEGKNLTPKVDKESQQTDVVTLACPPKTDPSVVLGFGSKT